MKIGSFVAKASCDFSESQIKEIKKIIEKSIPFFRCIEVLYDDDLTIKVKVDCFNFNNRDYRKKSIYIYKRNFLYDFQRERF